MPDLKPCPFCGCDCINLTGRFVFACWCDNCFVKTFDYETEEKAIKAWNRRAGEDKHENYT